MLSKRSARSSQNFNAMNDQGMNQYYSVEFTLDEIVPLYQFKLRNSESMSLYVLVKEDSEILNQLEVGRVLKMKYYNTDATCPPEFRTTQIDNITSEKNGRYSGHCMVGLSILPTHQTQPLN